MVEHPTIHPFFDSLGQSCPPHAPGVNFAATARLERALNSPVDAPGRGILLRAPRAGFGKSHLLAHLQQRLGTSHEFLPLSPLDSSRIDAGGAIEAALRRLTRPLPAGSGLTGLDLLSRRLFSVALQPLVSSGEVPCQDREVALSALRQRPVETFDFHHSQAVTAHWTKENFEVLGPRLALELSRRTGSSLNESSFWLASLFRFAVATPEHPGRTGMIIQSAVSEAGPDRYASLLALLSLIGRVVVVADDLEGMHADPTAALRFASFISSIRQEAPRVDLVVSVNDDVWESAFRPALSGGLLDRLGELEIRLEPLDEAAVASLLEARNPGRSASLGSRLAFKPGELYARLVLRKVAELDDDFHTPVLVAAAAVIPPPPVAVVPPVAEAPPVAPVAAPTLEPVPPSPVSIPEEVPPPVAEVPPAAPVAAPTSEPVPPSSVFFPEEGTGTQAPASSPVVDEPNLSARYEPQEIQPVVDQVKRDEPEIYLPPEPAARPDDFATGTPPAEADAESSHASEPASGGDRIDDLLRQFRERYGRE